MDKPLVGVEQAESIIAQHIQRAQVIDRPLDDTAGEILRTDVCTERDEPPFDRVMMDGIAICHQAYVSGLRQYLVQATQAAGKPPLQLENNDACIVIMTGAVLPKGCDCIVPVEEIDILDGCATLHDGLMPRAGQYIHWQGSDRPGGTRVLESGTELGAVDITALAASGRQSVAVSQRPRISVFSTGDELVDPGLPIESFQVRRSNPYGMVAALKMAGYTDVESAHLPDDPVIMQGGITACLRRREVLVLSGGVSMGKHDYVPEIMESAGVKAHFHGVSQRPGKPMWFGTGLDGQLVFALPGNPVSVLVCLYRYVLPALQQLLGGRKTPPQMAVLTEAVEFAPKLTWFLPVTLGSSGDGALLARPNVPNTSGDLTSLAETDGFVELPPNQAQFPAGFTGPLYRWRQPA